MPRKRLSEEERKEYRRNKASAFRARNPGYGAVYKTRYRQSGKAKARLRLHKSLLVEAFGGRCQCCGNAFHHAEFDFHHVDKETKERPLQPDRGWETLVTEAAKCVMLCANCHRLYHYFERNLECETILTSRHLPALKLLHGGHIRGPSLTELLRRGPKLSSV